MRLDAAPVVAAALVLAATLAWPRSRRGGAAAATSAEDSVWGVPPGVRGDRGYAGSPSLWHQDPVELFRRWLLRRRSGELADDVLELLRGVGPALDAGLTPSRSIELAAAAALGPERVARARESAEQDLQRPERRRERRRPKQTSRVDGIGGRASSGRSGLGHRGRDRRVGGADREGAELGGAVRGGAGLGGAVRGGAGHAGTDVRGRRTPFASRGPMHDIDHLVGALLSSAERAEAVSVVWTRWATRSGSAELALVAAAWQLSETTGAPLSFAVDRAVRGLLDARARRRKVAVAVAGPRATVTVLTLLPLTGPLFGLAVGVDPRTLYLGSGAATACLVAGLSLVWAGRAWCTHMVRRAVSP